PNLKERRHNQGTRLSGGEQQMLAMARILRAGARLLLLDEVSEGLAPVIVQKLSQVIQGLKERGLTILLVEQNFCFASKLADRMYVVERGRIAAEVGKDEMVNKQSLLEELLGVSNPHNAGGLPRSAVFARAQHIRRNYGETQADKPATRMSAPLDSSWGRGTGQNRRWENLRRGGEDRRYHRSVGTLLRPERPGFHHRGTDGGGRVRWEGARSAHRDCVRRSPEQGGRRGQQSARMVRYPGSRRDCGRCKLGRWPRREQGGQ